MLLLLQIDNFGGPELAEIITKWNIKSPESGNDLTAPQEFNLMFDSSIGPTGHLKGYAFRLYFIPPIDYEALS